VYNGAVFEIKKEGSGMKSSIRRSTTIGLVLLLVLIAIARVPTAASAASVGEQVVMLVPGISGSSTLLGHSGWIELVSFAGSAVASPSVGTVQPCQMVVQKPLDIASPHLWVATVTAQLFDKITIQLLQPSPTGGSSFVLYDIQLENARFTSIGDSASNASPLESLTFKADKVVLTFNKRNPNGTPSPVTTTFTC
jgi:type VI secretion system Hcp family effector